MTASVKIAGTWTAITKLSAKVGGTWYAASKGWVKVGGTWVQWFASAITDTFTRTAGSLGTTDNGSTWTALRGNWGTDGSKAYSNDAASNNSLASVPLGNQNATTGVDTENGMGVAFWVTDAGSWYAAVSYQGTQTVISGLSYACSSCYAGQVCNTCSHTGGSCGSTVNTCTSMACPGSYYDCSFYAGSCVEGSACYNCDTNMYQGLATAHPATCTNATACGTTDITCTNADCTACGSTASYYPGGSYPTCSCGSYSYGGTTTTVPAYFLRLISQIGAGVVSTVTGDVSLASQAARVLVSTTGNQISATALDSGGNVLGSSSVTPASPTKGTNTGIIKISTSGTQGSKVDNFYSSPN